MTSKNSGENTFCTAEMSFGTDWTMRRVSPKRPLSMGSDGPSSAFSTFE